MKIIDELKKIGVVVARQSNTLIELSCDEGVLFEVAIDEFTDNSIKEAISNEIKSHLEKIDNRDEAYFDECDAEYLLGEWRQLLVSVDKML